MTPSDDLLRFSPGAALTEHLPPEWLDEDHIRALTSSYYPDIPKEYRGRENEIGCMLWRIARMQVGAGGALVTEDYAFSDDDVASYTRRQAIRVYDDPVLASALDSIGAFRLADETVAPGADITGFRKPNWWMRTTDQSYHVFENRRSQAARALKDALNTFACVKVTDELGVVTVAAIDIGVDISQTADSARWKAYMNHVHARQVGQSREKFEVAPYLALQSILQIESSGLEASTYFDIARSLQSLAKNNHKIANTEGEAALKAAIVGDSMPEETQYWAEKAESERRELQQPITNSTLELLRMGYVNYREHVAPFDTLKVPSMISEFALDSFSTNPDDDAMTELLFWEVRGEYADSLQRMQDTGKYDAYLLMRLVEDVRGNIDRAITKQRSSGDPSVANARFRVQKLKDELDRQVRIYTE